MQREVNEQPTSNSSRATEAAIELFVCVEDVAIGKSVSAICLHEKQCDTNERYFGLINLERSVGASLEVENRSVSAKVGNTRVKQRHLNSNIKRSRENSETRWKIDPVSI
jgi:hypothetical protein